MKKGFAFLLTFIFSLILVAGQVWAEADSTSTMVLKETSDIYTINGKELKFEKPFTKQDTLMSALDPIIKTMSISTVKSSDGKTITLKYSGSTIVMYIGSKDALVDGVRTTVSQAPVSVNGSIMVPLRFVAETFGGEVSVDSKTQDITVTKETAGDNSIKDFSLLLKKTSKETVGDSYYKWTMSLPKDVKISYRSFNGAYNTFEAVDGSYSIYVSVYNLSADETIDTLIEDELQYAKDYTLISQEKSKKNGLDHFRIAYKDDEYIYEERNFIKDNKIYELYLEIQDEDIYKNDKGLAALLDSFIPGFVQDGSVEDLSDVIAGGYRIYEDKKLKYSMKVPADWYESGSSKKENQVTFVEQYKDASTYSDGLTVYTYSKEDGLTLDKWNEIELQYIKDEYNPDIVKLVEAGDLTVNNGKAKKIVCSTKFKDYTSYSYNVYITGEHYKYHIYYVTTKPYDNKIVQSSINYLLENFNFSEPDAGETESFLDPQSIVRNESIRSIDDKNNKLSFELPTSWQKEASEDNNSVSYSNSSKTMSLIIVTKKDVKEQQYIDLVDETLKKAAASTSDFIYNSKQVINSKDTKMTSFDIDFMASGYVYSMKSYIFTKNDIIYEIALSIQDFSASEKNKKILDDIWESIKLQ